MVTTLPILALKMKHTVFLVILATVVVVTLARKERQRDKDDEHIEKVTKHHQGKRGGWKAGRTSLSGTTLEEKKKLAGVILESPAAYLADPHKAPAAIKTRIALPAEFDARTAWPKCQSIQEIRNQGQCGCCWAHAGASVISDRICIASGSAATYFQASVQDPIVCSGGTANYCNGAQARVPYIKYVERGIVTGGGYQSNSGCMPYTSYTSAAAAATNSSTCTSSCTNTAYSKTYANDKAYGANWYALGNQYALTSGGAAGTVTNETVIKQIQYELMTNGPVTVQTTVYEDFYSYTSGVYQYVTGASAGGHAMKLVGWGTEDGLDYWLIANSWGTSWGIGGFVKFLRGVNHLAIEDYMVTALPQVAAVAAVAIPACGDNAASRAYCKGKWRYALFGENVCSNQFCCCPGTCTTATYPFIATCPAGKYMDPTPSIYSDNCALPSTIPACSTTTIGPVTTTVVAGTSTKGPVTTTKVTTIAATTSKVAVSTTPAATITTTSATVKTSAAPITVPVTVAPTTPPVSGRPAGYDRCDALFCNPTYRADGYYWISNCSRNYCSCKAGVGSWYGCAVGQFFDKDTNACKVQGPTFCPIPTASNVTTTTAWPTAPASIAAKCNQVNCDGRGADSTWYTLDLCTPYWCYCWQTTAPKSQGVQTCGAGQYFDFRSEVAACVNMNTLPWC